MVEKLTLKLQRPGHDGYVFGYIVKFDPDDMDNKTLEAWDFDWVNTVDREPEDWERCEIKKVLWGLEIDQDQLDNMMIEHAWSHG